MKIRAMVLVLAFLFVSLWTIEMAHAGAWTVPKYKVYTEYYMKWDYGKSAYNADGKERQIGCDGRSWEFVQEPKLEYGLTDWFTAMTSFTYKESFYKEYGRPASWGSYAQKNNGVTDVKVGARIRWFKVPVVFSTQTRVAIYGGYGVDHGDDPAFNSQPGLGYGDDWVEERVLMGKVFSLPLPKGYKLPCYWGAETGYRWRNSSVCGDVPYFVEGGFWPCNWLLIKSELDGYTENGGTGSIKESYGIWRIGYVWQVFGGDSVLRQGNKLFNIEMQYGMTVYGKNTTKYQEWVVKVQTQF